MSDPSGKEARERPLIESFLELSGEHSMTHHEPLQPVVMQPVESRTFPVRGSTDCLRYVVWCYDNGVHGCNICTLAHHDLRPRALTVVYGLSPQAAPEGGNVSLVRSLARSTTHWSLQRFLESLLVTLEKAILAKPRRPLANAILTVRTILGLLLPDLKLISLPILALTFAIRSSILLLHSGIVLPGLVARPVLGSLAPTIRHTASAAPKRIESVSQRSRLASKWVASIGLRDLTTDRLRLLRGMRGRRGRFSRGVSRTSRSCLLQYASHLLYFLGDYSIIARIYRSRGDKRGLRICL
ncbi:unnamed protein product, partial [Iphiclides podalirius]